MIRFVRVLQEEDEQGRAVSVFVCRHDPPRRASLGYEGDRGWCSPTAVDGRRYVCGKSAADRDPRSPDPKESCVGGLKACATCLDNVARFAELALNASAVREEFELT